MNITPIWNYDQFKYSFRNEMDLMHEKPFPKGLINKYRKFVKLEVHAITYCCEQVNKSPVFTQ